MANRSHQPDEKTKKIVLALAALIPHEDIAKVVAIDPKTLRKYYREELDSGLAQANARVGQFLLSQAQKNLTAAIFWAKTRMGWREVSRTELTGENGEPIKTIIIKDK